jgi:hypothetical protein
LPLRWRWEIKANLSLNVAIIHGRIKAFIALHTDSTRFVLRVQVMVAILAGTGVAPFRVFTDGILVTVVSVITAAFILVPAVAFPVELKVTGLALTDTLNANRV